MQQEQIIVTGAGDPDRSGIASALAERWPGLSLLRIFDDSPMEREVRHPERTGSGSAWKLVSQQGTTPDLSPWRPFCRLLVKDR